MPLSTPFYSGTLPRAGPPERDAPGIQVPLGQGGSVTPGSSVESRDSRFALCLTSDPLDEGMLQDILGSLEQFRSGGYGGGFSGGSSRAASTYTCCQHLSAGPCLAPEDVSAPLLGPVWQGLAGVWETRAWPPGLRRGSPAQCLGC